jgi:hypothetical protein
MALPPLDLPPPGSEFDPGPPPEMDPVLAAVNSDRDRTKNLTPRDPPDPEPRRKALVGALSDMVKQGKNHWDKIFRQMEKDQKFAAGVQWPEDPKKAVFNDIVEDDLYVANITLQHIQKRVAAVYAKNPQVVCRRRPRILSTVWDGTMESLAQAQATMQQAQQATMMAAMGAMGGMGMSPAAPGMAPPPGVPPMGSSMGEAPPESANGMAARGLPHPGETTGGSPGAPGPEGGPSGRVPPPPMPMMPAPDEIESANMVIQDAQNVKQQLEMLNKICRTLELLYDYEVDEQQQSFKSMMKMTVRRAATSGVGWTRLGFQRVLAKSPDVDNRIADIQNKLDLIERATADLADGEITQDDAAAEQLRLTLEALRQEQDTVVREGLLFTWPKSTAIIPDPRCIQLRDFLGCDWVAEEFMLSVNEVQETYGVDVGKSHTSYARSDTGTDYERARSTWSTGGSSDAPQIDSGDTDSCLVWEVFNKKDGLVYVICDGYPDFLREPAVPDVYTDRFWPWFLTAFNEIDGKVFPPSDVSLIRPMQRELNRSRQGLREHRIANRPKIAYAEGTLSEDDISALKEHPVNALIAISGLQPGQDINTVLMGIKGVPVDPNLYEVNPIFEDLMRSVGVQEADLGGAGGNTATETSIAASAKASATGSSIDDIDETLSAIARASGQILLLNVSEETVKSIVGPGAMWPFLTKDVVARDLYLEIRAGSSGRPDQAQELQNFERLAPILMQLPGIKPAFMVKQALKRMDDKIDIDEAIADGIPSITSMNGAKMPGLPGVGDPNAQGPQGASNSPAPPSPSPQSPTPQPPTPGPGGPSASTRLQ